MTAVPSYSNPGGPSSTASFSSLSNLANVGPVQNQRNPETDSFVYIETLLESLSVLGKLGGGLDIVAQRLPGEIFALIDSTVDEVSERTEYNRRTSLLLQLRLSALESSTKHADHEILRDLFWTLYSKLDAVMQGLRVVYEVAKRIGSVSQIDVYLCDESLQPFFQRRDFKDSSGTRPGALFPLSEIWMPVQAEVCQSRV